MCAAISQLPVIPIALFFLGVSNTCRDRGLTILQLTTGTSATVTQGMNHLFSFRVPGLGGQTIADVVEELEREGCLSLPWGESVRNQFFGELLWNLEMESNCDADTLESICLDKWGLSKCHRSKRSIVHIGEEKADDEETNNIDAANWNKTLFGDGTSLEYTTNSISYFRDGPNIVIDITGNGVYDTCNKKIRIPVAADVRDKWVSPVKLYRFWKLRVKGYTAVDTDTMTYIIAEVKNAILNVSEEFQRFYCQTVLIGNWTSSQCNVPSESCSDALSNKTKFDDAFEIDLEEFWNDTAKELADGLECRSCSNIAGDVCSGGAALCGASFLMFALSFITATTILVLS